MNPTYVSVKACLEKADNFIVFSKKRITEYTTIVSFTGALVKKSPFFSPIPKSIKTPKIPTFIWKKGLF